MLGEDERHGTRRFWLHMRMLRSKLDPNLFVIRHNYATSGIFLLPMERNAQPAFSILNSNDSNTTSEKISKRELQKMRG